jgi:hypothetical protein
LIEANLSIFSSKITGISCHGVSAMDSYILLSGRPHGGCSILWRSSLACDVSPIDTGSKQVCAVIVKTADICMLICNVYMPTDTKHCNVNLLNFDETLESCRLLATSNNIEHVIIGGDFNTDFSRANSLHTVSLRKFIADNNFREPNSSIDHTFESMINGEKSTIDHFFVAKI